MGQFWDERAKENALYFIDNTLDYSASDLERFYANGKVELDVLLDSVGARIEPGDTVVEIGCGYGRMTREISARAENVVALDVSAEMLAGAQEHNGQLENVEWVHGDGESLAGVADGNADVCFSNVVFQHIPDPQVTLGYIREIGRVLRPGGWSAFQVSNDPKIHRFRMDRDQWRVRLRSLIGRAPRKQSHKAWRGSAMDLDDVRAAADDGGMDVERIHGQGTQLCFVLTRKR
jgi:SAM-dependent methyltransferase